MDHSTHPTRSGDDVRRRDDEPDPPRARHDAAPVETIENHHFQRPVVSPVPPRSAPPPRPARATP